LDYVLEDYINEERTAYPYSLFYVYYDQYGYIRSVAIENILLGMAVVFLAVTIVQDIKVALIICLVVLVATLDLIGFVWVTN
jgi:Niemann-Pick C1 protein